MAHPSGALYVRLDPSKLEALRAAGEVDYDPARGPFARIERYRKSDDVPRWVDEPELLQRIADGHGELIAYYDCDADAFWYFHVRRDGSRRTLMHDGEAWTLEGEPDGWEADCLFGPGTLERALEQLADDVDADELDAAEAELRLLWARGRLEPGSRWPWPDLDRIIRGLCGFYGLVPAQ
jgi:hypothetical protein